MISHNNALLAALASTAIAAVAPLATAQDTANDARAIFLETRAALDKVDALRFDIDVTGTGSLGSDQMPSGDGKVELVKLEEPTADRRFAARASAMGTSSPKNNVPTQLDVLVNDGGYNWIDHENKVVTLNQNARDRQPETMFCSLLWPVELVSDEPFERELNAESLELKGTENVNGVECDVIQITYAEKDEDDQARQSRTLDPAEIATSATWYIAKEDRLPRRVSREQSLHMIRLVFVQDLTNVEINPDDLVDAELKLERPEEYSLRDGERGRASTITAKPDAGKKGRSGPMSVKDNGSKTTAQLDRLPEPVETPAEPANPAAPAFELVTVDGDTVDNEALAGRVGVFYFWGTWCVPCRRVSPLISELAEKHADEPVSVYGVAVNERNADNPREYMEDKGYAHTLLLHPDDPGERRVANAFKVTRYPTVVVIDANGGVAAQEIITDDGPEGLAKRLETVIAEQLKSMTDS